ncbi:MAG: hypothetical protein J0H98_10975 [Solirubrobacterales bacterium]|nr:hypothetical protein [Solirubrobacterales bacterium]
MTRPRLLTALLLAFAVLACPAQAAEIFGPKVGKKLTGVSDNGTLEGFQNFAEATGKHPAILQTFHPWGNGLDVAYRRWQNAEVMPMLHISTADDETREELITPQEIAIGAGDPYLIQINQFFAEKGQRAFIRPLGEPNRCLNPYTAFTCSGARRGGEHTTYWYRKAFQRIAVITRGGLPSNRVDKKLRNLRMRKVNWGSIPRPGVMPAAPVSIVWSTLPAGSPRVRGNWPGNYWPGANFVDWAGTDFYSDYPHWRDLDHFAKGRPWRSKPLAVTEWGVAGVDDYPFVRRLFNWMNKRPRVRMFVYYRGFGGLEDRYNPYNYPTTLKVLRNKLRDPQYLAYAFGFARRR